MYTTKLETLEELRDQFEHAISDIPLETIQTVQYVALFDVVVGSVLWQKMDILNVHGLKDVAVEGGERSTYIDCINGVF